MWSAAHPCREMQKNVNQTNKRDHATNETRPMLISWARMIPFSGPLPLCPLFALEKQNKGLGEHPPRQWAIISLKQIFQA